jgi:hypothetical protein
VGLVYDYGGLPGVTTARRRVAVVLQLGSDTNLKSSRGE